MSNFKGIPIIGPGQSAGTAPRSGDKYIESEDGYYTYCGRGDDMLKVSGIWVSPFEVESALASHHAVLEAAVVGHADENGLIKSWHVSRPRTRCCAAATRQKPAGTLQVSALDRIRPRAAQNRHREDSTLQIARLNCTAIRK